MIPYKHQPDFCKGCGYENKWDGSCKHYKLCNKWMLWFKRKWLKIQQMFKVQKKENGNDGES